MRRYSSMVMLIFIVILYWGGLIEVSEKLAYSLSLSALIFSISMVFDTYAVEHKAEKYIRMILETLALSIAIIVPNLSNQIILDYIMNNVDNNLILILTIFFTLAAQIACDIKIKDIRKMKK